jgi:hypothetical protein
MHYRYDEKFGDPDAEYRRAVDARPEFGQPEIPATFVATVEGEMAIGSMWGNRSIPWRTEPGTPCVILGYWADGTVRLSWPAVRGAYRVIGRFPAWVVTENPDAKMAAGGHILEANDPPRRKPNLLKRLARRIKEH